MAKILFEMYFGSLSLHFEENKRSLLELPQT